MTGNERDYVGYAGVIPDIQWPNGGRVALSIVVNYEEGAEHGVDFGDQADETVAEFGYGMLAAPDGSNRAAVSFFEYGSRAGIWRLLRILARYEVKATLFACAVAVERNPAVGKAALASGHEICCHGYRWENHFSFDAGEERTRIRAALDSLERTTGVRPVGIFVNKGVTQNTRRIIVDEGLIYDSNSYGDDVPFFVTVGGVRHLVLPYAADTNDTRYWTSPGISSSRDYGEYLCDTLDVLIEEAVDSPRMMTVGLHARISGRPGRAAAFERFIKHAKAKNGVWIARRDEIARWWIQAAGTQSAGPPA